MTDIMTAPEAAAHLNVSDDTIRRMCEDGRLNAHRWGRVWVVDAKSVQRAYRLRAIRRAHERTAR